MTRYIFLKQHIFYFILFPKCNFTPQYELNVIALILMKTKTFYQFKVCSWRLV